MVVRANRCTANAITGKASAGELRAPDGTSEIAWQTSERAVREGLRQRPRRSPIPEGGLACQVGALLLEVLPRHCHRLRPQPRPVVQGAALQCAGGFGPGLAQACKAQPGCRTERQRHDGKVTLRSSKGTGKLHTQHRLHRSPPAGAPPVPTSGGGCCCGTAYGRPHGNTLASKSQRHTPRNAQCGAKSDVPTAMLHLPPRIAYPADGETPRLESTASGPVEQASAPQHPPGGRRMHSMFGAPGAGHACFPRNSAAVLTLTAWLREAEPLQSIAGGLPERDACAILPATFFVLLSPLTWHPRLRQTRMTAEEYAVRTGQQDGPSA